ncbi:MAG: VOC family protein [Nocardioidaceae bacterium]
MGHEDLCVLNNDVADVAASPDVGATERNVVSLSGVTADRPIVTPRQEANAMASQDFPAPTEGFVLTHFIVAQDVGRSRDFYTGVLGGEVVLQGEPTIVKLANGWIIINVGGGPTDDKPDVVLEAPTDPHHNSAFLNIRVADIEHAYREWTSRGAEFLTPPTDRGAELRCYMRDPDGHLIEVGQSTRVLA